ncbi:MAG: DUF3990 domain-containing protein [Clostridiales bacterium]|jgi:hypothetical protein|nr:DUF3990 domain-containing protein [Clostridiales bacterium]
MKIMRWAARRRRTQFTSTGVSAYKPVPGLKCDDFETYKQTFHKILSKFNLSFHKDRGIIGNNSTNGGAAPLTGSSSITLCHGSVCAFDKIDVTRGKPNKDFGRGTSRTERHAAGIARRGRKVEQTRLSKLPVGKKEPYRRGCTHTSLTYGRRIT